MMPAIDSSFSAKIGDTFIVSESGKAHMNFGAYKPGGNCRWNWLFMIINGEYGYMSSWDVYPSFVPRVQAQICEVALF